jgi:hypothetical protein
LKLTLLAVEKELSEEPQSKGVEVSEGLRKVDILPLRVFFHVDEPNRAVVVDGILWIDSPR